MHTHTHQKKVIKEIIQKLRRWTVSPDSANAETIQTKHNSLTVKTYCPNFRILSAATRSTGEHHVSSHGGDGRALVKHSHKAKFGAHELPFPFRSTSRQRFLFTGFLSSCSMTPPYLDKTKNLKESIFSTHTHSLRNFCSINRMPSCSQLAGTCSFVRVHSLTPRDNYWAQCLCNLRTWNYQGKIFKGKKKKVKCSTTWGTM